MADIVTTDQTLTPNAGPASAPASASSNASANGSLGGGSFSVQQFFRQPAIARAMPLIILSAVIVAAISAWLFLREPPQRDIFRGLSDNDKAAVMAALDTASIPYQVDHGSGALTVSEEDYHGAKIKLAGQGLPRSAPSGDSIMSNIPMGASRAVESEKLRTAREMDLARSIEALDNVMSARVHLAVEQPSIFLRDRNEPAASVILQLAGGGQINEKQTQAIVNLVASSVPGLSPSNISVIDQNGRLLSRSADTEAGENEEHLKIKAAIEDRYRQSLASLLTPIVGAGNFVAEITADVNFDEKQATSEIYPAEGSVLRSEQGMKSVEPIGTQVGGIPGALANRPPEDAGFGDQPDEATEGQAENEPRKSTEEYRRNFELAREIAVTNQATGQVSRLSVAVAIDDSAFKSKKAAQEVRDVESLIKGAIGFNAARGDQIAVTTRKFKSVATENVEQPWYEAPWVAMVARNVTALIVSLLVIFVIGRPLLNRWLKSQEGQADQAEQTRVAALPAGVSANSAAVNGGAETASPPVSPVTVDMIQAAPSYQERALLTQNFVKQNPDHAALVVKELLKESNSLEKADG